jgi:hypothetical protein
VSLPFGLLGVESRLALEIARLTVEVTGALLVWFQPEAKGPPAPFPGPPL